MADTIKISELDEIASGALDDTSIVPVVDGGTTYKLPITKLKAFVGDSFATDSELSTQIANVNSTISGLDTSDISENGNLYYTDARVKSKLNTDTVLSGSQQITDLGFISESVTSLPDGTVSGSQQIIDLGFIDSNTTASMTVLSSSFALTASYALNAGGGAAIPDYLVSGSQQIIDMGFINNELTASLSVLSSSYAVTASSAETAFLATTASYALSATAEVPQGTISGAIQIDLTQTNYATFDTSYVPENEGFLYYTDARVLSYINTIEVVSGSGGGGTTIPDGTVSSSAQVISLLPNGTISSSFQVVLASGDFTGLTSDDISEGTTNLYSTTENVISAINTVQVLSGSGVTPGTISGSAQISDLGFIDSTELSNQITIYSASQADLLSGSFLRKDIEDSINSNLQITGSILLSNGSFSGSGAELFGIPQSAIAGVISTSQISDVDVSSTAQTGVGVVTFGIGYFNDGIIVSGSVNAGAVYATNNIVSSSEQIAELLPNGLVSGSAQIATGTEGEIQFVNVGGEMTSSTDLKYISNELQTNAINVTGDITLGGDINGGLTSTGSFQRIETTQLIVEAYSFPEGDGNANQYLVTDGAGTLTFTDFPQGVVSGSAQTIANLPNGTISSSFQVSELGFADTQTPNVFTADQIISGTLYVTQSSFVDTMVIVPRTSTPLNPVSGSIISSGSGATIKPYYWDGNIWQPLY